MKNDALSYTRPTSLRSLSIIMLITSELKDISAALAEVVTVAKYNAEDYEIIIGNEGGNDTITNALNEFAKSNDHVKLLTTGQDSEYGSMTQNALNAATKDWIFFIDATQSFEPSDITHLIPYSDTNDIIVSKTVRHKSSFKRRFGNAIFNIAVRVLFGINARDIDRTSKLIKRSKLHEFELISENAMINAEILHRAKVGGMRIKRVAMTSGRKSNSDSNSNSAIRFALREFYTLRRTLLRSDKARMKFNSRIVFFLALLAGVLATFWSYHHGAILAYGDAEAHLNIAKRVTASLTPGVAQLGGIWLPLPHLLMMPFVLFNPLWRSGIGGSIVSVAALVWLCVILYKLAYEITGKFTASYIAPLVVLINPNSLYLATTPMTELLLLSMFASSVYWFVRWLKCERLLNLVLASIFTFLATLSRYDGWALALVEFFVLITYLVIKRRPLRMIEGLTVIYSFFAFMGIALWLLWNKLIFNNFMYFSNSVYGSKEQQQYFLHGGYLPTYHNLGKSLLYFLQDVRLIVGLPVVLLTLLGIVFFLYRAIRQKQLYAPLLIILLLTPVAFYVVSLYVGQASLILPTFAKAGAKYTLSNTRYGVQILPFIALFAAYLVSRYRKLMVPVVLILLAQAFSFVHTDSVIAYADGTRGLSSQTLSKGPDAASIEQYMRSHYDKGLVLMDDYRRPIGIVESGVPMQDFIGSGNKPYWNESFDDPGKHASWLIIQKSDTDAVWTHIKRKDLIDTEFSLVYKKGNLFVYKRHGSVQNIVLRSGPHLTLNHKPFVINAVNSYDLVTQSNNIIDQRIQAINRAHLNTVRTWCYDADGTLTKQEFGQLDYLLQQANDASVKVICVFGNTLSDYGGPAYFGAANSKQFFTAKSSIADYEAYISKVMNHKSSITGESIKNNPAILAWELINEPRIESTGNSVLANWVERVGEYVASQDQAHLISPGTEGFTDTYVGQPYNENHGSSIETLCNLEVVTLCSGHLYPKYLPPSSSGGVDYSAVGTILHTWRAIATKDDKPFYVGETGYDISAGTVANRAAFFDNVRASLMANQIDGAAIWNLGSQVDNSFTLQSGDPPSDAILDGWRYSF